MYAVVADTTQELGKLFLRFQEYYEGPEFKGKVFTLDEFKPWYQTSRSASSFTYYDDWSGFNIPGTAVEFVARNFKNLSDDEKWLIDHIKKEKLEKKYYVIGYEKGAHGTMKHEIAHAMFYLKPIYRAKVGQILFKNEKLLSKLGKHLLDMGYNESVIEDEKHAYLLANRDFLKENKLWKKQFDMISRQIGNLFEEYGE